MLLCPAMAKKPYFKFRQGYGSVLRDLVGNPSFSLVLLELMTFWFAPRGPGDPQSRIFPSIRTMASLCGIEERTVKRAYAHFRKRKILVQVGWENRNPMWEVPDSTRVRLGI